MKQAKQLSQLLESFFHLFMYDVYRSKNTLFPFFLISWFNTTQILWLLNRNVLPLPLSELFISFHASDPSYCSPWEDFPRSFQKGAGGRIKSSGTEFGRSIRSGIVHPGRFRDCSDDLLEILHLHQSYHSWTNLVIFFNYLIYFIRSFFCRTLQKYI